MPAISNGVLRCGGAVFIAYYHFLHYNDNAALSQAQTILFQGQANTNRRKRMKSKPLIIVAVLLVLFFTSLLNAETVDSDVAVQAEGLASSREDALLQAKRSAVEQGIGTILISQTEIKNFELQKDIILTKTIGSVRKYAILQDKQTSDGAFFVEINAIVSLSDIKTDLAALKILLESMDKPRMMVLIQEKNGKTAENTILNYLKQKEFDLVDAAAVAAQMNKGNDFIDRAVKGDAAAAAQLGADNGAEYVIVGSVEKSTKETELLKEAGMISGQANISAKVVNCSNARIVASNSASGAAYHVSEKTAMANASVTAAEKLMDRRLFEMIVTTFQDTVNNGILLDVLVKNVPNFKTQKHVRAFLTGLANVVSVSKKSFGNNRLQLAVRFKGNADAFSESVDGKSVGSKHFSVTDIASNRVVMVME
jgi:hypothetical protein